MNKLLFICLIAAVYGHGQTIVPFTCETREGPSLKHPHGPSTVSCEVSETLVSCGVKGTDELQGTYIDPAASNICSVGTDSTTYSVTAVANCCKFPFGSIKPPNTITSETQTAGNQVLTQCPSGSTLTGCQVDYKSGTTNNIRGSYPGPQKGTNTPPAQIGTAGIDTENQCIAEAREHTNIRGGAQCLETTDHYELDCVTTGKFTNRDGFTGDCPLDYQLIACNTYTTTSATLDAWYLKSGSTGCYVQQDNHEDQYANGICCQLREVDDKGLPPFLLLLDQINAINERFDKLTNKIDGSSIVPPFLGVNFAICTGGKAGLTGEINKGGDDTLRCPPGSFKNHDGGNDIDGGLNVIADLGNNPIIEDCEAACRTMESNAPLPEGPCLAFNWFIYNGAFGCELYSKADPEQTFNNAQAIIFCTLDDDSPAATRICEPGTIQPYVGTESELGESTDQLLIANGDSINRKDYPELCELLGDKFGVGNSKECVLPDLRGRFPVGANGECSKKNDIVQTNVGGKGGSTWLSIGWYPKWFYW